MQNILTKFSANKIILIAVIIILAVGVGYYIYSDLILKPTYDVGSIAPTPTASENPIISPIAIPDLDRPITIKADLPQEAKVKVIEKIKSISSQLKENNDDFNLWLELGIYRKMIDDFEGARDVWEYAGYIRPLNSTSFNNLGDLYAYYLHDNKKAKENFLKAMENGSNQISIYRNAYDFYRNVMKDNIKAKGILEEGIKNNPDTSQDLQYLLDNF
ncbi:hypothetical protein KJ763_02530 [Patescibacteria group bacterium]|nr:hypothetical protein [Patescibacteria group bacterium]